MALLILLSNCCLLWWLLYNFYYILFIFIFTTNFLCIYLSINCRIKFFLTTVIHLVVNQSIHHIILHRQWKRLKLYLQQSTYFYLKSIKHILTWIVNRFFFIPSRIVLSCWEGFLTVKRSFNLILNNSIGHLTSKSSQHFFDVHYVIIQVLGGSIKTPLPCHIQEGFLRRYTSKKGLYVLQYNNGTSTMFGGVSIKTMGYK